MFVCKLASESMRMSLKVCEPVSKIDRERVCVCEERERERVCVCVRGGKERGTETASECVCERRESVCVRKGKERASV